VESVIEPGGGAMTVAGAAVVVVVVAADWTCNNDEGDDISD
jgi:hypothetical protein